MNILMLGRWLPPPRRPVKGTREYHFARQLARAHRLTLAFITDNPEAAGAISALRSEFGDLEFAAVPWGWKSLSSAIRLATGEACTPSCFRSEALRTRLEDRLHRSRYDLVLVSASSMIQYALEIDSAIPLVVDFAEVDSEWWTRQASRGGFPTTRFFRAEATRLRTAEAAAARRAARCLVATREAAQVVEALAPATPTTLIPNGVDLDFFGPSPRPGKAPTVIFNALLGAAGELANAINFYRVIIPVIRARVPEVRFVASGDSLATGRMAADLGGIEIVAPGTDLRLLFHSQAVAAAPLPSEPDLRRSLLEPMAAGVPVVTTSRILDLLGATAGCGLQVSDVALDFGLQIVQLLEDPLRRTTLGARGRDYVAAHHAWSVMTAPLPELVEAAVKPALRSFPPDPAEPFLRVPR
jgi:glycosyltransferase involved in cell wall biosynthesis